MHSERYQTVSKLSIVSILVSLSTARSFLHPVRFVTSWAVFEGFLVIERDVSRTVADRSRIWRTCCTFNGTMRHAAGGDITHPSVVQSLDEIPSNVVVCGLVRLGRNSNGCLSWIYKDDPCNFIFMKERNILNRRPSYHQIFPNSVH